MKKRFLLLIAAAAAAFAQQAQDPDFAKSVKEWTTRPEFMSPLIDHLPKANGIPSPKDVLGYYIGTPKKLTHTADLYRYYRALESSTKRVKVIPIGRTDEGREQLIVVIGDEDTIRNLDTYKGYLAKLADPRGLTPDQAKQIVGQAKLVYMFTGGLHSAETGPPEMLMELAYRLVVEEAPAVRSDPQEHNRHDRPRASNPTAATVTSTGITATRSTKRPKPTASPARPTGASTFITTTIATSITRRSRCAIG